MKGMPKVKPTNTVGGGSTTTVWEGSKGRGTYRDKNGKTTQWPGMRKKNKDDTPLLTTRTSTAKCKKLIVHAQPKSIRVLTGKGNNPPTTNGHLLPVKGGSRSRKKGGRSTELRDWKRKGKGDTRQL